jgi:hypothetical protein
LTLRAASGASALALASELPAIASRLRESIADFAVQDAPTSDPGSRWQVGRADTRCHDCHDRIGGDAERARRLHLSDQLISRA